jgi:hypothetical protein
MTVPRSLYLGRPSTPLLDVTIPFTACLLAWSPGRSGRRGLSTFNKVMSKGGVFSSAVGAAQKQHQCAIKEVRSPESRVTESCRGAREEARHV